jgi:hypothetical protein
MRSRAHTALTAPLVLHHTRIYKRVMKKIIFNGQMWNKLFLIVIYQSSPVKAAVNAGPICKLRNGVKKRLNFFFFQWSMVDQVRNEYSPHLSKLLYNCTTRKRTNTSMGSRRMGGGRIFLKSLRETSFNKGLSNEPNFGRIHLAGQYRQIG